MARLADRVQETSTTTGTGAFTLAGAVLGFQSFAAAFADADAVFYVIVAVDASGVASGAWEVGIGTVGSSGTSLARDVSVYASSNAGALVNFGAGTKHVFVDRPAAGLLPLQVAADGDPVLKNASAETVLAVDAAGHLTTPLLNVTGSGVAASYTTDQGVPNADLTYTAVSVGPGGNSLGITYIDPGGNNQPLTFAADGNTLQISLATDAGGLITTTAQDIIDNFDADGLGIDTPTLPDGSDGTGVVTALGETILTGGLSAINVAGPSAFDGGTITTNGTGALSALLLYAISGTQGISLNGADIPILSAFDTWAADKSLIIAAQGAGTIILNSPLVFSDGAGNVIILPTIDPAVVGALWNNAGTITVSAG